MTYLARRVQGYGTSIFTEMTQLANRHQAVNLGQGVPDIGTPDFLLEAGRAAISAGINQYAPCQGRPRLRRAIADMIERRYGLTWDPDVELTVTAGASEGIEATILGLVDPGDEVIVIEPYFDTYVPNIRFAGGVPRFYQLRPPDWALERERLEALFTPRTKLLLLNTPHNPTGKVFTRAELQLVADLCTQYDVLVMVDEVYEHLVYDDAQHLPLASLPGMRDRTITLSSLGKTFSATGWKVGWATGSAELIQALVRIRQFTTFSGAAPLQEGAAVALEVAEGMGYYTELNGLYRRKRDFLMQALRAAGLNAIEPRGTFFVMVDISPLGFENDVDFCYWLVSNVGVGAIPPSAFYDNPQDGATLVRFAFCRTDDVLYEAAERLRGLRARL